MPIERKFKVYNEIVSGFGEKMRREREMRGISLEEISESTKIGTRSLRALEQEEFEKLPGGIFNKGFVRAYSRFLGLDEDQAVADFDTAWKEYQTAKGPPPEIEVESPPEKPEPSSSLPIAVAAIVLLVIFAGGYGIKYFLQTRSVSSQSTREAVQQPAPVVSSEAQQQPAAPHPVSEPAASPEKFEANQSKPQEIAPNQAGKTTSTPALAQKADGAAVSPPLQASSAILLEVTALEDSWLSVSADGKSLGQGILTAQKSRTIRANKEVRLRLGNVAGVEVSFNGKAINIDGEPKQVKELTFTPDGLQR